jgi:cytochrome c oxidase subunit IV
MKTQAPSQRTLFGVWVALLALLLLTWGVAKFDLGAWNIIAALTIAVAKMLLVVVVFMHLRYSVKLIWVFAAAGIFWLFIMITLTMSDYLTRGLIGF